MSTTRTALPQAGHRARIDRISRVSLTMSLEPTPAGAGSFRERLGCRLVFMGAAQFGCYANSSREAVQPIASDFRHDATTYCQPRATFDPLACRSMCQRIVRIPVLAPVRITSHWSEQPPRTSLVIR
jgi:hypothetical protein